MTAADDIKALKMLFSQVVYDDLLSWLYGEKKAEPRPVNMFGKRYYVLLMHPRQAYLMRVHEARLWYKETSREIRMLKYFER